MAALGADVIANFGRQGELQTGDVKAATAVYSGGFIMRDVNGKINPNVVNTTASVFLGLSTGGMPATTPTGVTGRSIGFQRSPYCLLLTLTSVTAADLGRPVYATTDNPTDVSLTYTAGAQIVGTVLDLIYQGGPGAGPIANQAWCLVDSFLPGLNASAIYKSECRMITSTYVAGTSWELLYRCPANRRAILLTAAYTIFAVANYATSCVIDLMKVVGTTATSLLSATIDVTAGGVAANTPTAFVGAATPFVTLSKGDRLQAKSVSVGAMTLQAQVGYDCQLIEYGYAN